MAKTEKQQQAADKYLKEKVEEFKVRVPKGEKEKIQDFAKAKGQSLNAFVVSCIRKEMSEE